MNTNQEIPMQPPPYNANNETLPTGHDQQVSYPNPSIQQTQPLPMGSPIMKDLGDHPITTNCPHCHQSILTRIEKKDGLMVWAIAGGICIAGFFCGCCLIPFFMKDLKDTIHYCPNCNIIIGENKKLSI